MMGHLWTKFPYTITNSTNHNQFSSEMFESCPPYKLKGGILRAFKLLKDGDGLWLLLASSFKVEKPFRFLFFVVLGRFVNIEVLGEFPEKCGLWLLLTSSFGVDKPFCFLFFVAVEPNTELLSHLFFHLLENNLLWRLFLHCRSWHFKSFSLEVILMSARFHILVWTKVARIDDNIYEFGKSTGFMPCLLRMIQNTDRAINPRLKNCFTHLKCLFPHRVRTLQDLC